MFGFSSITFKNYWCRASLFLFIMTSLVLESEDVAAGPPGFVSPLSVSFSPNGNLLTYLFPDQTGSRQVYAVDLNKSFTPFQLMQSDVNKTLSLQEQLRRERMRLFTQGISTYEWAKPTSEVNSLSRMLIPLNGSVFLFDDNVVVEEEKYRIVYDSKTLGEAVDPHISPDGKLIAFVINDDLYVQSVESEVPIRLTVNGANKGVTCGLADFIAQEEMHRFRGFWWSPDSTQLAYCEADETAVPEYKILHQGKSDPKHDEVHHYPFAGDVNPSVRLAVVRVPSFEADNSAFLPEPKWMGLIDTDQAFVVPVGATAVAGDGTSSEYYLARVGWWADGSVMAQVEDRAQSVLQLLRIDPVTGLRTVVLEERSAVWINLHEMVHTLSLNWAPPGVTKIAKDFYFIWASERSGFMQLYLYRYDAALQRGVAVNETPIGGGGHFVVESLDGVDEALNVVYFSGNRDVAIERHLYRAALVPEEKAPQAQQLTAESGFHNATVNVAGGFVADVFSSVTSPVVLRLYGLSESGLALRGELLDNLFEGSRLNKPGMREALVPPVFRTIRSLDGLVDLHCALYLPPGVTVDSALRLPAIMSVYGGPHVQTVRNQWTLTAELRSQRMAQQGFVVIKCDNRGSSRRGLAFEGAMHRDMGNIEVSDQTAAVQHFAQAGLIDASRVGMFGWSYGGYMSAMSLCRAPDVFSCAVAGAPVTSWDGYDTHYTERYMGTPQNNIEGYANSSVMTHAHNMRGKLLLVHGLIDENVHFRHTARLINRLIECRKRYELILFPCERHSPHKLQDRVYMEDIMQEFFAANLKPEKVTAQESTEVEGVISGGDVNAPAVVVKITAHL